VIDRIKFFLKSIDNRVWDIMVNGHFEPIKIVDNGVVPK